MFKTYGLLFIGVVVAFVAGSLMTQGIPNSQSTEITKGTKVTVYKSPTCGCCGNYAAYLRKSGFDVEIVETNDMDSVKAEHHVPGHLASCHTTVLEDGSVVEGHVPVEAIRAMMADEAVTNIGMAGMPSGSPGMPGPKQGLFSVHSFQSDGSSRLFTEL